MSGDTVDVVEKTEVVERQKFIEVQRAAVGICGAQVHADLNGCPLVSKSPCSEYGSFNQDILFLRSFE